MVNKHHHAISLFTLIVVFNFSFVSLISQDVFAAEPEFTLFVADDPDDLDTILSNGDILTITFSESTNATNNGIISQAELIANFTDNDIGADAPIDWGTTFSGVWNGDSTVLTVTLTDVTGATLSIGSSTIEGRSTTNISSAAEGTNVQLLDATTVDRLLTGDFGLFVAASTTTDSGSGCSGDCEEPTLGMDSKGKRLVDNGFTYNGKSIDVERYFTPYPLVTVQTGKQNVAEFKIYENGGPDKISHFELAFGLANGESIGMSKVIINWDKSFDGIETVTLVDPENVLENIQITTLEDSCSEESQQKCLMVKIEHTFRAPLDFNILGTNVWDSKRNAWQNYYNHGIEVVGESLNPPKEYDGIHKGHIYHLIETGKTNAVDESGNAWSLKHGQWMMDYVLPEKVQDPQTMVMTRTHSDFAEYKTNQAGNAISYLLELCPDCLKQYDDFDDSFSYEYPESLDKMSNPAIQKLMYEEELKAKKYLTQVFE